MERENHKRLPLKSVSNFRDMGGYSTTSGGVTRWKTFVRGEESHQLDELDVVLLYDYGIRTVVDLRCCGWEAQQNINFDPLIIYKNIPLIDDYDNIIGNFYFHMLDNCQNNIKRIFEYIGERISYGGILYNCVSGKDRTGIISAILLLLCDVSELDVIADYMVSAVYLKPFAERHNLTDDKISSNAEWMADFIFYLKNKYSGVSQYLLSINLSHEIIEDIKKNFII